MLGIAAGGIDAVMVYLRFDPSGRWVTDLLTPYRGMSPDRIKAWVKAAALWQA